MLQSLVNHNSDLEALIKKGYAISVDSNYLVVRDIPYLDENKNLVWGAFVSKMVFSTKEKVTLEDHQIFFSGSQPYELDGSQIRNLGGGPASLKLEGIDLVVQRSFSNKPQSGFGNFYDKIESYVNIISGPAMQLYQANPLTFRSVESADNSVFLFQDTLTSRAELGDLNEKFKNDVIAIIGLGGTGAYVLDFLVKTPVREIRGFDLDKFNIHNAFRSPGKLEEVDLDKTKAEVYQSRYGSFRKGLNFESKFIQSDSNSEMSGVTFAFVCVDKGESRNEIFKLLRNLHIPFIDVGMGLQRVNSRLSGMLRVTNYPVEKVDEFISKKYSPLSDNQDDIYKDNIQISELNALNACIAVMKYKQLRGFYNDDSNVNHLLIGISDLHIVGE